MLTRRNLIIAAAAIAILWSATILALHFGQIHHDRLPYEISAEYPPNKPFKPGEIFASTLAAIVDHELHSGFGWRPNDLFFWGPHLMADNNSNRQLGIIMAVRETTRVFKDNLTKVSSNQYDPNLVIADTDFRNDAARWALPSPERKYQDGVVHLRRYVAGLRATPETSRELNQRAVELVRLFQVWTDLLGDGHAMLYKMVQEDGSPVHTWDCDDYFYHAQGYAHVMFYMTQALQREYATTLAGDPVLKKLFDDTLEALGPAATMKPIVILNGSPTGIFANHRRNLDAYISEARQKMYSIREELERSPL
ncbi:MAG TPA: DUF2333 family protein [Candidatus Binataceae bacterium]|nr:DUF2333 family protein [Candidatus Binataceae bacterium]